MAKSPDEERAKSRAYYAAHKDYWRSWYAANRDHMRAYYQAHRVERIAYAQRRRQGMVSLLGETFPITELPPELRDVARLINQSRSEIHRLHKENKA